MGIKPLNITSLRGTRPWPRLRINLLFSGACHVTSLRRKKEYPLARRCMLSPRPIHLEARISESNTYTWRKSIAPCEYCMPVREAIEKTDGCGKEKIEKLRNINKSNNVIHNYCQSGKEKVLKFAASSYRRPYIASKPKQISARCSY